MRETITFRPKRTKRQLQEAFGNVSEKLNELVERELSNAPAARLAGCLKAARAGGRRESLRAMPQTRVAFADLEKSGLQI